MSLLKVNKLKVHYPIRGGFLRRVVDQVRAVDGNPTFMPQGGQLTTIDKQKITDWINAGGRTTD